MASASIFSVSLSPWNVKGPNQRVELQARSKEAGFPGSSVLAFAASLPLLSPAPAALRAVGRGPALVAADELDRGAALEDAFSFELQAANEIDARSTKSRRERMALPYRRSAGGCDRPRVTRALVVEAADSTVRAFETMTRVSLSLVTSLLVGCGGAAPEPVAPSANGNEVHVAAAPAAMPIVEVAAEEPVRSLPMQCVEGEGAVCTLPADFGERLCAGAYPEVAIHLFAPKTPWKRVYLQKSFQAWHVGGRGEMRELRAGEEVLVVKTGRGDLTGGQAFDVLRWDGTCVSLMEDEISFRKPASAVPANIPWKRLEPEFQSAFAEEKHIENLRASQAKLCDGAAVDKEPKRSKCELARRQLSQAIAQAVAKGKSLPPLRAVP